MEIRDNATPSAPKAAPKKGKSRRKRRRRASEQHVGYLVRLTGWHYYYSFSVSDPRSRWDPGPYSELATLSFAGDVIRPEDGNYKRATITFSVRSGMVEEKRSEPPQSIGSLTANHDQLTAYIFVPTERMAELAAVTQSGRVQIIYFRATRLRYRSGLIRSISLDTRFDEEEW